MQVVPPILPRADEPQQIEYSIQAAETYLQQD
jgi:hypothetical protein